MRTGRPTRQVDAPLLYATSVMAVRSSVLGHPVPLSYRLASLYLGCASIDRGGLTPDELVFDVLDPLPTIEFDGGVEDASPEERLHEYCHARAVAIVVRARREQRAIRILWSGGIDSPAASCSLLCAAEPGVDRLSFYFGNRSRAQNPRFYNDLIKSLAVRADKCCRACARQRRPCCDRRAWGSVVRQCEGVYRAMVRARSSIGGCFGRGVAAAARNSIASGRRAGVPETGRRARKSTDCVAPRRFVVAKLRIEVTGRHVAHTSQNAFAKGRLAKRSRPACVERAFIFAVSDFSTGQWCTATLGSNPGIGLVANGR